MVIDMDFKLEVNQNLKLALTTEIKLALDILQMNSDQLIKYLEEEKNRNSNIEIKYSNGLKKEENSGFTEGYEKLEEGENLIEFLYEQLRYEKIEKNLVKIVEFLINNLDNRGYLIEKKEILMKKIGVSPKVFNEALEILHSFEPVGIGAEDLVECLRIQAKHYNSTLLNNIIENNLKDIAEGRIDKIASQYNEKKENIIFWIEKIKKMNPKPSRGFYLERSEYITPDIIVKTSKDEIEVVLNDEKQPKIIVKDREQDYGKILAIARALEKRGETLLKVTNYILQFQSSFLLNKGRLKTLKIKDIAYELGYHESTISRAVKNKYLNIDYEKTVPLKNFLLFSSKRENAKELICYFIENESEEKPVSDEELSRLLSCKGIDISRRTVSKYREELGIKSSKNRYRR